MALSFLERRMVELICKVIKDDRAKLEAARLYMKWAIPGDLAEKHLDQFLDGAGGGLTVDLGTLLRDNPRIESFLQHALRGASARKLPRGTLPIRQATYDSRDWQYALGAITLQWERLGSDFYKVWFRNTYRWHPDEPRPTQCLHGAGARLDGARSTRSRSYVMKGELRLRVDAARPPRRIEVPGLTYKDIL